MNKLRRVEIKNIVENISNIYDMLSSTRDDECDYHDSIPENLQYSQRADDSQDAIDYMDDALSNLSDAIESLNSIV